MAPTYRLHRAAQSEAPHMNCSPGITEAHIYRFVLACARLRLQKFRL